MVRKRNKMDIINSCSIVGCEENYEWGHYRDFNDHILESWIINKRAFIELQLLNGKIVKAEVFHDNFAEDIAPLFSTIPNDAGDGEEQSGIIENCKIAGDKNNNCVLLSLPNKKTINIYILHDAFLKWKN